MKTELPLITYVVKAKYITNNAGLKILHEQKFTNEEINIAREKALEYYDAAINVLTEMDEISTDQKTGKIMYKNPEQFDKGIGLYMRINYDVKKSGIADKTDTRYLICAHYDLQAAEKRSLNFGNKIENQYAKLLKINLKEIDNSDLEFRAQQFYLNSIIPQLKRKTIEEIEFIKFDNPETDIDFLMQSACAFLNTNGGTIIIGQDENMNNNNALKNISVLNVVLKRLLEITFDGHKVGLKIEQKNPECINFLEITITKSETETLYQNEYYERNRFGNMMDLDKSYL